MSKRESVIAKIYIDNGLHEIQVKAVVSIPLVENGFSHPFGYEQQWELDFDRASVEIVECYRSYFDGEARVSYEPTEEELKHIQKRLIKAAMNSF